MTPASTWPVFFFDGNRYFHLIDNEEQWKTLIGYYRDSIDEVLASKMAQASDVNDLPSDYFFGTPGVHPGRIPSFGFRREHVGGRITLEEWARNRGVDLRKLALEREQA